VGIGIGLNNSGVFSENDPAKALLYELLAKKELASKFGAAIGLGFAYAGTAREEFIEQLVPLVLDTELKGNSDISGLDVSAFSALTLGLIFVGKCNEDIGNAIIQTLMDRTEAELNSSVARFFVVALGLLFMGQQEKCEATLEALAIIPDPIGTLLPTECLQFFFISREVRKGLRGGLRLRGQRQCSQGAADAQVHQRAP